MGQGMNNGSRYLGLLKREYGHGLMHRINNLWNVKATKWPPSNESCCRGKKRVRWSSKIKFAGIKWNRPAQDRANWRSSTEAFVPK